MVAGLSVVCSHRGGVWVAQPGAQKQPEISVISHDVAALLLNAQTRL